jgi:hypothetical protein
LLASPFPFRYIAVFPEMREAGDPRREYSKRGENPLDTVFALSYSYKSALRVPLGVNQRIFEN